MDPRWDPDYRPTWDAFFINRHERALARHEEDGPPPSNFNETGRQLWWRGRTLQSVMNYISVGDNPRMRYPPRFNPGPPSDGSNDDGGDFDDYEYEYYRPKQEYD